MESETERQGLPEGFWAGLLFIAIILLALIVGVAQLVIHEQYTVLAVLAMLGVALIVLALHRIGQIEQAQKPEEEQ